MKIEAVTDAKRIVAEEAAAKTKEAIKAETAAKYGDEQVKIWRRSYDIPPPELDENDDRYLGNDCFACVSPCFRSSP